MPRTRTGLASLSVLALLASIPAGAAFEPDDRAHPAEQRLLHVSQSGLDSGLAWGPPVDRLREEPAAAQGRAEPQAKLAELRSALRAKPQNAPVEGGALAGSGVGARPAAPMPEPSSLLVFAFTAFAVVRPAIRRYRAGARALRPIA